MHTSPLADQIASYVADLFPAPPTPEPSQTEPPFTPLSEVITRLIPSPGEVLVAVGMPATRMLTAAVVLAAEESQIVAIDKETYAGATLGSLVMAVCGVTRYENRWDLDRVLGAAEALRHKNILQVSNGGGGDLLTRFAADADLVIVEAERFVGGLAGIAREAARTGKAVVAPQDHHDDLPAGPWEVVRLFPAGSFASGHRHMTARFEKSGDEVRLARGGPVGRFL